MPFCGRICAPRAKERVASRVPIASKQTILAIGSQSKTLGGSPMKFASVLVRIALALGISACATTYKVTPVPDPEQKVHYTQGTATTYSETGDSAVQVTPYGVNEEGRLVFGVALFNKTSAPGNFGVENLSLTAEGGAPVKLFSYDELVREARNRATWAEIGLVVAGAASAYAASENAYSTTNGSISGPYGTTTFYARTYDPAAAYAGSAAAGAATGYGIAGIEYSLDRTLVSLRNHILQTTTIDPRTSFGGSVITDSLSGSYPHNISLAVNWGTSRYTFQFVATKNDQPAPAIPASSLVQRTANAPTASQTGAQLNSIITNLGVNGIKITDSSTASIGMPDPHGVFVQALQPQSPAATAGINVGDIIVAYNGQRVESMDDLNHYIASTPMTGGTTLSVWRNHKVISLALKP